MKFTRKGAVVALTAAAMSVFGLVLRSPVAVAAGVFLFAAEVLAYLSLQRARLAASRTVSRARFAEGEPLAVRLEIVNDGGQTVYVEIRDALPRQAMLVEGSNYGFVAVPPRASETIAFKTAFATRGYHPVGPLVMRVTDGLRLLYEERELVPEQRVLVEPASEDLKELPLRSRLARVNLGSHLTRRPGDGFEFYSIRTYMAGDSPRSVNWKASARASELLVNQRSHESYAEVTILLDAREVAEVGIEQYTPLAQGARAVASLTTFLLRRRDVVRVYVYGGDLRVVQPGSPGSQLADLLETLATVQAEGHLSSGAVVDRILPALRPRSPVALVSSLEDDSTLETSAKRLIASGNPLLVVSPRPAGLGDGADSGQEPLYALHRRRTIRRLRGYGAAVLDWEAGKPFATSIKEGAH